MCCRCSTNSATGCCKPSRATRAFADVQTMHRAKATMVVREGATQRRASCRNSTACLTEGSFYGVLDMNNALRDFAS